MKGNSVAIISSSAPTQNVNAVVVCHTGVMELRSPNAAGLVTRANIAAVAKRLFEERGFSRVSVRAIAAQAGVEASSVVRLFGSKEELFVQVTVFDDDLEAALDVPQEEIGRRLVAYVLAPESTRMRAAFAALVRASDHENVRQALRDATRSTFVNRLMPRIPSADAFLRAELVAATLSGLMHAGMIASDQELASADQRDVITIYGHAIQSIIDGALSHNS